MVKPRMNSWIDEHSDESGKTDYTTYLTITMPDQQQDIEFEATFSDRLKAEKWCSELENALEGCMVSICPWSQIINIIPKGERDEN